MNEQLHEKREWRTPDLWDLKTMKRVLGSSGKQRPRSDELAYTFHNAYSGGQKINYGPTS